MLKGSILVVDVLLVSYWMCRSSSVEDLLFVFLVQSHLDVFTDFYVALGTSRFIHCIMFVFVYVLVSARLHSGMRLCPS